MKATIPTTAPYPEVLLRRRFREFSMFRCKLFCNLCFVCGICFLPIGVLAQDKPKVPPLLQLLFPLQRAKVDAPAKPKPAQDAKKVEDKKDDKKKAAAKKVEPNQKSDEVKVEEADFAIVDAVNVDPFQQQFTRQFRSLVKAEVFFLNGTCQTTPEQRGQIKVRSEEVLKEVVKTFVDIQKKMNQGGFDWNSPAPEPRKHIQDALAYEAKRILSAEQVALYETELARRQETRKLTSITNVVARMDDELILTAEQRVKLTAELTAKWKAAETQQMEIFLYGEHYFPNVPEQFVMSVLNDKQKDVWRGMTRSGNIFFGIGHTGHVAIDENAWGDDVTDSKPAEDAKVREAEAAKKAGEAAAEAVRAEGARISAEKAAKAEQEKKEATIKPDAEKVARAKEAAEKLAAEKAEAAKKQKP